VGEPQLTNRENLGAFREAEVRKAAAAIGVRDIFFLPFTDPHMEIGGTARHIDTPLEIFAKAIGDYIERLEPDLLLTHGSNGEYGHPQHIYTHEAVRQALSHCEHRVALVTWCAWFEPFRASRILNQDDPADIIWEVVSPWLDAKIDAALCHKTQHAMFLRNTGAPTVAEMVPRVESFRVWNSPIPADLEMDGRITKTSIKI
jgi:LmbE family N-acetylglucosaminyl deacetylase